MKNIISALDFMMSIWYICGLNHLKYLKYMKMIKRITTIILLCCASIGVTNAEHIDIEQAREIGMRFLQDENLGKKRKALGLRSTLQDVDSRSIRNSGYQHESFYAFNCSEDGFIIVAADDNVDNLIGAYSPNGSLDFGNLPKPVAEWLSAYDEAVRRLASSGEDRAQSISISPVEPLLTTKWNQNHPFNIMCPVVDSDNGFAGCTITALAQIMKYWNYPDKGHGIITNDNRPQDAPVDLSLSHYDWDNMLDIYDSGFSNEQANAVALLMRDLGVLCNADYQSAQTPASFLGALELPEHFGYSDKIKYFQRNMCTSEDWRLIIYNELKNGRPVLYCGYPMTGDGHAFVCDGIDSRGLLHINWGWGGLSDGYFDMNILSPANLGIGAGGGRFFFNQWIITGIAPEYVEIKDPVYPYILYDLYLNLPSGVDSTDEWKSSVLCVEGRGHINEPGWSFLMLSDEEKNMMCDTPNLSVRRCMPDIRTQNISFRLNDAKLNFKNLPDGIYYVRPAYAVADPETENAYNEVIYYQDKEDNDIWIKIEMRDGHLYFLDRLPSYNDLYSQTPVELISVDKIEEEYYVGVEHGNRIQLNLRNNNIRAQTLKYSVRCRPVGAEANDYVDIPFDSFIYDRTESSVEVELAGIQIPGPYSISLIGLSQEILPETPCVVELKELPDDIPFIITGNSTYREGSYFISNMILNFSCGITYKNEKPDFYKNGLTLWGYHVNESEEREFYIGGLQMYGHYTGSETKYNLGFDQNSFRNRMPGQYITYVKYRGNGEDIIIPGSANRAVLDIQRPKDSSVCGLASPISIIQIPVESDWKTSLNLILSFDLTSYGDLSVDLSGVQSVSLIDMNSGKTVKTYNATYRQQQSSVDLSDGHKESFVVDVTGIDSKELSGQSYYLMPEINIKGSGLSRVWTWPYLESTVIKFDQNVSSGIKIGEIQGEEKENFVYYDLLGRKVSNPNRGIYIKNNKKVIVR